MTMLPKVPPKEIPLELYDDFTLRGGIPVRAWYFDDRVAEPVRNNAELYARTFQELDSREFSYYGNEAESFYDALEDYDLRGKNVLIWGLAGCNCEAIAVWAGAAAVYVVDYNRPVCEHEKIRVVTHEELGRLEIKFDFAISFSSFEHDGLGRYGDPVNPYGDLKAMQQARKVMTDEGILFLGVPLGRDLLVWNAHRIYGPIRLPRLLAGWLPLDVYSVYRGDGIFSEPFGTHLQPLLALRNSARRAVPKAELAERLRHAESLEGAGNPGTRNGGLLRRILEMLLAAEKF